MTTRTITAMFNTKAEAERAGEMLVSDLRLDRAMIRTSPGAGVTDTGYDQARPYEEKGFFGSIKDLFVPDEDRHAYAEGMRRGSVLLSAQVDEGHVKRASDILENAGAVDLDQQEATWRKGGWTGYDATAHSTMRAAAPAAAMPAASVRGAQDDTIKVMEERLVVGKRMVEHGSMRVRAYVVERPVEKQVTLHEERVQVERHPVNRPATPADLAAMADKTIEARATSEEAVVSKEARIVEEIGIHKEAADRTETVRDTVRKTEVNVEDTAATASTTGTTGVRGAAATGGSSVSGAAAGAAGAAKGAAGAVDRTLNTNVSGANPGADAPDGTPGNPKGTMASRAVDKTLGTNISGTNPDRK